MSEYQDQPASRPSHRLDPERAVTSGVRPDVAPTVPLFSSGNLRPARARSLRARLTERDRAILRTLADFRLMTGRQLQQLYVSSSNPVTAARRTRAVLRRLSELRAVVRLERRIGGIQAGSEGHVYGLSGLGHAVLALDNAVSVRGRTVWETKPAFQDHLLAISQLYVELVELQRRGAAELLGFETEPTAWRQFAGPSGERLPVKPDAFVALGVGEFEQRAFIEMDCGTESLPTVQRKCRRYLDYWRSGSEQRRHGVFPRVWWLVHSERRRQRLTDVVAAHAPEERVLFAVALAAEVAGLLAAPDAGGQS